MLFRKKVEEKRKTHSLVPAVRVSPYYRDLPCGLAGFSYHDVIVIDKELSRALARAAHHREQTRDLLSRDQSQGSTLWTCHDRPIGIVRITDVPGIFEYEHRSRTHLFRNPFAQDSHFTDHITSGPQRPLGCRRLGACVRVTFTVQPVFVQPQRLQPCELGLN